MSVVDGRAPRRAADRQLPARRHRASALRAALRQRMAGAARRGLAYCPSSMISPPASARRSSARRCRARSSTSTAIPAAPRSIPARRRPSFARRRPSTASRSIAPARRRTRRDRRATRALFRALSRRARRRDRAAARAHGASRSTTRTRSARASRACSMASCRCSTSEPTRAAPVRRRLRQAWAASSRRAARATSSTAASKAAGSPAPSAIPQAGVDAIQMELACRAYMAEPERIGPDNWPTPLDEPAPRHAPTLQNILQAVLSLRSAPRGELPMNRPLDNMRVVRAPRGPEISAKSWLTEAPLRMLMNNLDPEVAERPDELVVYGGIGRAARDWDASTASSRRCSGSEATRPCWCSRASRSACSARTPTRRAC